VAFFI